MTPSTRPTPTISRTRSIQLKCPSGMTLSNSESATSSSPKLVNARVCQSRSTALENGDSHNAPPSSVRRRYCQQAQVRLHRTFAHKHSITGNTYQELYYSQLKNVTSISNRLQHHRTGFNRTSEWLSKIQRTRWLPIAMSNLLILNTPQLVLLDGTAHGMHFYSACTSVVISCLSNPKVLT